MPTADEIHALLDAARAELDRSGGLVERLTAAAAPLEDADRLLSGVPGVRGLLGAPTSRRPATASPTRRPRW